MNLYLERVTEAAKLPESQTTHSACFDVFCDLQGRIVETFSVHGKHAVKTNQNIKLYPGDRAMIPTGWKMSCDPGWKIELAPRSGNAIKRGITLINSIGIVDADFSAEVMLLIVNLNTTDVVTIEHGERLAQLSLEKVHPANMIIGKLPGLESNRAGGFGSTG